MTDPELTDPELTDPGLTDPGLTDNATREAFDGSAVAGHFAEVFGIDLTSVTVTCGGCGGSAVFAEQRAYLSGPGAVLRCPGCDHMLARIVQTRSELWLDLSGSSSWRFPFEADV